jgi:hypothetical protein
MEREQQVQELELQVPQQLVLVQEFEQLVQPLEQRQQVQARWRHQQ